MPPLFNRYSAYLKEHFGKKVYRISVDGPFSCPNRDENRRGGCRYCDERGIAAGYLDKAQEGLEGQIAYSRRFLSERYGAEAFLLYFQSYSSTFAPVETLKTIYDSALSLGEFIGLTVSTRPDCLDEEKADLLASYQERGLEVWVELGLQSAHNASLDYINRGHTKEDFDRAYRLLVSRGINVAIHLIFGLPGEGWAEIEETIRYVASLSPGGVKFHNLHIPTGSALYSEYAAGELSFPSSERHRGYVIRALELLPPETVIMRLTTDTPKERHQIPGAFWDKNRFYQSLEKEMNRLGTYQGRLYEKPE